MHSPTGFVNIHGQTVYVSQPLGKPPVKKRPKDEQQKFHKGFAVEGIPPGGVEEAQAEHRAKAALAMRDGTPPPGDFDSALWLMNARGKRVRTKPYEIRDAADVCASMAEKAGWLRVRVVELKKE